MNLILRVQHSHIYTYSKHRSCVGTLVMGLDLCLGKLMELVVRVVKGLR